MTTPATPAAIAATLRATVDESLPFLSSADDIRTTQRAGAGTWSPREVLGHLIDSASTNHRRFVLAQSPGLSRFDGYEQNAWVERQRYHEVPWPDLVALWSAYNRHLAHVIAVTPEAALLHASMSPDGQQSLTLGFVMEDYVHHMRHHLEQLRALLS